MEDELQAGSVQIKDPLESSDAVFEARYVEADSGVELLLMSWRPKNPASERPLIFVPGWVSVIDGWKDLLRVWVKDRTVYYIETREKGSARIAKKRLRRDDFTIRRVAADIVNVCRQLPENLEDCVVAGSSLGATSLLEAMKNEDFKPHVAFLIGPNGDFKMPFITHFVLLLPAFFYHIIKHYVIWYLKTFRVDEKREPEQMQRYRNTLLAAHPQRIKLSTKALMGFSLWPNLERVQVPVGIAYAGSHKLHKSEKIERIAHTLTHSLLIRCESNKYMHSAGIAREYSQFVSGIEERV